MDLVINTLVVADFFLFVALAVALWERYEDRRFPRKSKDQLEAEARRKSDILGSWRR